MPGGCVLHANFERARVPCQSMFRSRGGRANQIWGTRNLKCLKAQVRSTQKHSLSHPQGILNFWYLYDSSAFEEMLPAFVAEFLPNHLRGRSGPWFRGREVLEQPTKPRDHEAGGSALRKKNPHRISFSSEEPQNYMPYCQDVVAGF